MDETTASTQDSGSGARSGLDVGRRPWWAIGWFGALMAITIGVRLSAPTGWLGTDDSAYYSAAEHVLAAEPMHRVHHHNARMAVVVPVALSVWSMGHSVEAVALPTLIASILCVVLVVLVGRLTWGWWEGLCAGTIVSVLPFFRVLSTVTFPDVHACLWAILAVMLAILAARSRAPGRMMGLAMGCGVAIGLATSAKVLSLTVCLGVAVIVWSRRDDDRRRRATTLAAMVAGGGLLYVTQGLFYVWLTGDFFFKLHALAAVQASEMHQLSVSDLSAGAVDFAVSYASLAWERVTMLAHPEVSSWGLLSIAFWPAALLTLAFSPRGRALALWAMGAYLLIALTPVSFRNGPSPLKYFGGRNLLTTCLPFALCLAWLLQAAMRRALPVAWLQRGWPVIMLAISASAYAGPAALNGFCDRPTSRVGHAIRQIVASNDWENQREIFVPVSLYVRYRILFPPELRSRLRVAVDDNAPQWWRDATVDIVSRAKPLPPPDSAYLIATPKQLGGELESWDYGVMLPRRDLAVWRNVAPLVRVARFADKSIGVAGPGEPNVSEPLVVLVAELSGTDDEGKAALPRPPPHLSRFGRRLADVSPFAGPLRPRE